MGLAELIDLALKNNPETTKSWASVKRSQAQMGVAKSGYYPSLDVQGKADHGRDVKFVNGPEVIYTNYGADLILSYVLLDFGERKAAVQATKEALKASNWSADFALQRVICSVSTSYYEYLNAKELLKNHESALEDAKLVQGAAEELCLSGLKRERDRSVSKALVAQKQMELAKARASVAVAYGKLLTDVGFVIGTKVEIQSEVAEKEYLQITEGIASLIQAAEKRRADVLAKKALLAEKHEQVRKTKKSFHPKVKLMGQGGWMEYVKHKDRGYNYLAGVALDIPLFKGFENSYQTKLALADEEITAAELKMLQEEVALEVLTYSIFVEAGAEAVKWSGLYLEEAAKSYEDLMDGYRAGLQEIFELLQAHTSLTDARMEKTEAKTKWLVSLVQLAFVTGSTGQ